MKKLGIWSFENEMPQFAYTGNLPYRENLPNGKKVNLPDNPFFLLGNPQISIFVHVGGEMEIITGRRSWGRMNFGTLEHQYHDSVIVRTGVDEYVLTGTDGVYANPDLSIREFGCGYVRYICKAGGVSVSRTWSVAPAKVFDSAFGNLSSCNVEILKMITRINGDSALVCSVQKWDTVNKDGSANPPFMMRQTNYLEKHNGEWKVLHEHTSAAADWDGRIDE